MTTRRLLARAQRAIPACVDRNVRACAAHEETVRAWGRANDDRTAFFQSQLALDAMAGIDTLAWLMGELYPSAGWRS